LKFGVVFVHNVNHFRLFDDACHNNSSAALPKSIWLLPASAFMVPNFLFDCEFL